MSGIGPRSLDPQDKRALLLESAERTFCRLGYARTSIAALAADAGVTRPTVYAYYPSKEEVFRALAERVRAEFLALQERADTSSPVATARSAVELYFDSYLRHRGMLTVIAHQAITDPEIRHLHDEIHTRANRRHTRFLQRLVDSGTVTLPAEPDTISEAITGVTMRFADLADDDPDRSPALRRRLVEVYLALTGLHQLPRTDPA